MATRIEPTVGVTEDGWVSLGVVARSHGVKGALKLHRWTDEDAALRAGLEIKLGGRVHRVAGYAPGVLELDDVHTREAADALRGAEVFVRRADFPKDEGEQGDLYLVYLIGAAVVDLAGQPLGTVEGFSDNGAQPLISVARPGAASVLVPYVPAIVRSAEKGRVVLAPPPGLFVEAEALE